MKTFNLPDKPSAFVRQVIADLDSVAVDPRYEVNMGYWHDPIITDGATTCHVCAAGAYMAKSLGVPITERIVPNDIGFSELLLAIDRARIGDFAQAIGYLLWHYQIPIKPVAKTALPPGGEYAQARSNLVCFADLLESVGS